MRFLMLVVFLVGCDGRDALVVPEADTDEGYVPLELHTETGECEPSGAGHWTVPQGAIYQMFACTVDEECSEAFTTIGADGVAEFICSQHAIEGDYWRVNYIVP